MIHELDIDPRANRRYKGDTQPIEMAIRLWTRNVIYTHVDWFFILLMSGSAACGITIC